MDILIDTNAFIWFCENDVNLSKNAVITIEDENNSIYVSVASFWEIAIKKSIGKLELLLSFDELYNKTTENGINVIPVMYSHTKIIENLFYHHKDPFDRIIISQSIVENMSIVTSDEIFKKYEVAVIW